MRPLDEGGKLFFSKERANMTAASANHKSTHMLA